MFFLGDFQKYCMSCPFMSDYIMSARPLMNICDLILNPVSTLDDPLTLYPVVFSIGAETAMITLFGLWRHSPRKITCLPRELA